MKMKNSELQERLKNAYAEMSTLRSQVSAEKAMRADAEGALTTSVEIANGLRHKVEVLETDVHNLLGAIRVMADSSREVRIRKSSVRDSGIGLALPQRNTD